MNAYRCPALVRMHVLAVSLAGCGSVPDLRFEDASIDGSVPSDGGRDSTSEGGLHDASGDSDRDSGDGATNACSPMPPGATMCCAKEIPCKGCANTGNCNKCDPCAGQFCCFDQSNTTCVPLTGTCP